MVIVMTKSDYYRENIQAKSLKEKAHDVQNLELLDADVQESSVHGVLRDVFIPLAMSVAAGVKCLLPGKFSRVLVAKVYLGGWLYRYPLSSMYQNSVLSEDYHLIYLSCTNEPYHLGKVSCLCRELFTSDIQRHH